jgi:hypothetical protein
MRGGWQQSIGHVHEYTPCSTGQGESPSQNIPRKLSGYPPHSLGQCTGKRGRPFPLLSWWSGALRSPPLPVLHSFTPSTSLLAGVLLGGETRSSCWDACYHWYQKR